jgi:hypothetical protein
VGPTARLDAVGNERIPFPSGNRTPVTQLVAESLNCLNYHGQSANKNAEYRE